MKLSEAGAGRIANYEGFRANAYWDVNHYSIGYGSRARSASEGPISMADARKRLMRYADDHVGKALRALLKKAKVTLNQNQFDAIVSIVYNHGVGMLEWDIGDALRAGDLDKVADLFLKYDKSEGVVLAGLTRRRKEERALFLKKPPVAYLEDERQWLNILRDKTKAKKQRNLVAQLLKTRAGDIQRKARRLNDWKANDRARRFQGIRRSLKNQGYLN